MVYSILLLLLSQVTVTSNWIFVGSGDVLAVLDPLTTRTWSLFNVIVAFAWVFILFYVVERILAYLKISK